MDVSEKQALAFELFYNPIIVDYLFGGGAGGGKSMTVTEYAVLECRKYPGIRIGVGRNEISNLRRTTIQTLLDETHPLLGVQEADFKYHDLINPRVDYRNGSQIIFVDLAYAPRDPNYDRLGSLNLTHVIIEEMGEVRRQAKEVFSSRKNRYLNKKYNIVGKFIGTCNPATNFLRTEYYDPYLKAGGGDYQMWPIYNDAGEAVYVYLPDGTKVPAQRCFIKSLVTDNPFISRNYIEELKAKPLAERKRLLEGNWDFYHDASTLFKRSMFVMADKLEDAKNFGGCDPSLGGDACVFTHLQALGKDQDARAHVKDQEKVDIPLGTRDVGSFIAERYIKFCKQRGIGYLNAAVDVIGIGQTVLDSCNRLGFKVQPFNAGSTTNVRVLDDKRYEPRVNDDPGKRKGQRLFDNIRSQNFYDMADAANSGTMTFDETLLTKAFGNDTVYDMLCTELEAHGYNPKENMVIVDKKDKIKAAIGHSPDYADSLQSAWWVSKKKHYSIKQLVSI